MADGQRLLRIGELANRGGVRVWSLRRLALIRAAHEAGLSLVEIRMLLDQRRGQP